MELGLPQSVVNIGGPSRTIMGKAEREGILPKTSTVQAKFSHVMKWAPNACSELEAGRVPQPAEPSVTPDEIRSWVGLIRVQLDVLEDRLRRL